MRLLLTLLLSICITCQLIGQTEKSVLSFDDIRQWRTHSVTLADNGEWYTTLYSLSDESESPADSVTEQRIEGYFTDNNQTDVLYICSSTDGVKYKVPNGSKPRFSSSSDWIAYQIKPEAEEDEASEGEEESTLIELRHLASGFAVRYESDASYSFIEDTDYFVTQDNNSLLIYDLTNRREHYIGHIGEYLADKESQYIAYTIASEDRRGNGIYLYDPSKRMTRALQTGNYIYSSLSWNEDKTALAAYKYEEMEEEVDPTTLSLVVIEAADSERSTITEYPAKDIEGITEGMGLAAGAGSSYISWSKDGDRLFLQVKEYDEQEEEDAEEDTSEGEEASVQIWHWEDEKLLSERIMEYDRKQDEVFDAVFSRSSNTLIQLTDEAIQELVRSEGTDRWAIGTDNRQYISDWDIDRNDLYRIDLKTGDRTLIREAQEGSWYNPGYEVSPDGEQVVYWDGAHYWCYDFEKASARNISEALNVSFVNKEYDKYGYVPDYGFVGWVKDRNAVLIEHKYDLWLVSLDGKSKSENLTSSITAKDSIRFRLEDYSFADESEIEDRYIDLSAPIILYAYHTQNKYAGFYRLEDGQLTELVYGPASYSQPWSRQEIVKSKDADAIIYHQGDYDNYPEAYLSTLDFSNSKKITATNPQQEAFSWGKRILIEYTNDDGVPLQGVLSIPDGYEAGQKLPMVVYSYEKMSYTMHRYPMPYLNGATSPEMLLVSNDYLFLRPDIHFNVGTPHSDMHECIDAAIEKVIELGYVNEEQIGYQGFSFGGHCGMYMSTQDNRFAAIAAGAGVSNLIQGFNIDIVRDGSNEQDYYMVGQGRLGADPTSNTEMYISESPVFGAQTMNTPLLLYHGTADKVVQWEHSFGFYSILRYLKKPVVFLSYVGEGHGLRKEENRLDIQRRLKAYFDHYLKGAEAEKWMLEETPYIPQEATDDEQEKRTLPKWK
ncbi:MAG: prolyl oligopeptidase family serine peptidase [Bacteroidota bacterium]